MRERIRSVVSLLALCNAVLVVGCGGGAKSVSTVSDVPLARSGSLTRFDVDVKTGKVTITPPSGRAASGRAIFTGGSVSFGSSDLISVGGDSGQRVIHLTVGNNSGQVSVLNGRLVVSNLVNNYGPDFKSNTFTSTYAGSGAIGSANGYGTAATFSGPLAVAVGHGGTNLSFFVADSTNNVIRRIFADGTVTTFAGTAGAGSFADGQGAAARFNDPQQICADGSGNLFVADRNNNRVRRITPLGQVTSIAGTGAAGSTDGSGAVATFSGLKGLVCTADGNQVYVSSFSDHTIRRIAWNGGPRQLSTSYTVSLVAGTTGATGLVDNTGAAARFNVPIRLTLAQQGAGSDVIAVADQNNNAIRLVSAPSFGGPGTAVTIAGDGTAGATDGPGTLARFSSPYGIDAMPLDSTTSAIFVSENGASAHRLRLITYVPGNEPTQKGNYTVASLAGGAPGFAEGNGNVALFNTPAGLAAIPGPSPSFSSSNPGPMASIFVADSVNNRIRRVNFASSIHSGGPGGSGVAEPVRLVNWDSEIPNQPGTWGVSLTNQFGQTTNQADLQFYVPSGVSGFSFNAMVEANTSVVNLPAAGSSYLTTVAGNGAVGNSNGPGKLAQFNNPFGLVFVPGGFKNSYLALGKSDIRGFIADGGNHRIRFISGDGDVGTAAGSVSGYVEGTGTAAKFNGPRGVALAPDGSVIIADTGNHRIRRMTIAGVVTTITGTGVAGGADGTGAVATVDTPEGIAADSGGTIWITDVAKHTVRKIEFQGGDPTVAASYLVTTVAGFAGTPGSSDGTGVAAHFSGPTGIYPDTDGRIYVSDTGNDTIRLLVRSSPTAMTVSTLAGLAGSAGTTDGLGSAARFSSPTGMAIDPAHNLYVTDFGSHRIRRVSPLGNVVTLIGSSSGFTDGLQGTLNGPRHCAMSGNGDLFVSDQNNRAIRSLQRVISTAQTGQ